MTASQELKSLFVNSFNGKIFKCLTVITGCFSDVFSFFSFAVSANFPLLFHISEYFNDSSCCTSRLFLTPGNPGVCGHVPVCALLWVEDLQRLQEQQVHAAERGRWEVWKEKAGRRRRGVERLQATKDDWWVWRRQSCEPWRAIKKNAWFEKTFQLQGWCIIVSFLYFYLNMAAQVCLRSAMFTVCLHPGSLLRVWLWWQEARPQPTNQSERRLPGGRRRRHHRLLH